MVKARRAVVCFGEALIDFLGVPGDGNCPRRFTQYAGGAPANVSVGVARLGGAARFVGMLSGDMFGDFLLSEFAAYGVDVTQVRRTDTARTALAFVSLDADGDRSFNFYRPPAADLLFRPRDFADAAFDDAAVLHVCSNSLTEAAIAGTTLHGMALAHSAGALVSMDLNLRPSLWPIDVDPAPVVWRALQQAHLVKLSREELVFLAGSGDEGAALARLFDGATQAIVVTDGASQMRWWTLTASGTARTFDVAARDATAAGDAFVAGLLHRIVERDHDATTLAAAFEDDAARRDLLSHAAACGAVATTRHGAFAAMPDANDVARLITGDAP